MGPLFPQSMSHPQGTQREEHKTEEEHPLMSNKAPFINKLWRQIQFIIQFNTVYKYMFKMSALYFEGYSIIRHSECSIDIIAVQQQKGYQHF